MVSYTTAFAHNKILSPNAPIRCSLVIFQTTFTLVEQATLILRWSGKFTLPETLTLPSMPCLFSSLKHSHKKGEGWEKKKKKTCLKGIIQLHFVHSLLSSLNFFSCFSLVTLCRRLAVANRVCAFYCVACQYD